MSYGDRVRLVRETLNKKPEEFALFGGITRQAVYQLEKGQQKLPQPLLERLAEQSVDINWLITGEGEMFLGGAETGLSTDLVRVKLIDAKVSAGSGLIVYEEGHSYISLPAELLRPFDPKTIELIRVDGHSMEPAMYPGDLLAVVRNPARWISERYFVIDMYKELRVKRLMRRANGKIAIISENPAFGTEEISDEEFDENVRVLARVVKIINLRDV